MSANCTTQETGHEDRAENGRSWGGVKGSADQDDCADQMHLVFRESSRRHLGLNQARMKYVDSSICNHEQRH
jgi:hypothetical protein